MTTSCTDFQDRVDLLAMEDESLSAADAAHLESCAACRAQLQRARAIERALAARSVPAPSTTFTARILEAVRQERWHAEQVLDLGFNVAVAAGLLLIVLGVTALAWRSGVIAVGGDLAAFITAGVAMVAQRVAPQAQNVLLASLLLTTALAVWWWAEGLEI